MGMRIFTTLAVLLFSWQALALSLSVLKGEGFRDDLGYREDKTTFTLEHFGLWELGTIFFYYDITEPTTADGQNFDDSQNKKYSNQFFGGTSVTLSLSRITGKGFSYGILKDVSIRLELENGSGNGNFNFQNYFYGLQYDLAVAGFDFLSLNAVLRDNPNDPGVGTQFGAFWQVSWDYGRWNRYKFTGFLAASPFDGDQTRDTSNPAKATFSKKGRFLTSQPQLLYDLGYGLWGKKDRLEIGFEYAYFLERFQQKDKDEKVLQYMVKWTI
jgi:nucleoside-specific outer membrane channel protein Tsx